MQGEIKRERRLLLRAGRTVDAVHRAALQGSLQLLIRVHACISICLSALVALAQAQKQTVATCPAKV